MRILQTKNTFFINLLRTLFLLTLFLIGMSSTAQKPFKAYNQNISGTDVQVKMIPIQGGTFTMGSPSNEKGRSSDEGPTHSVEVAPFWMAEFEITWDLYNLYVHRSIDNQRDSKKLANEASIDVDAVSGATVPYIVMDFGMGVEGHPAVSMTQLAASRFCEWLTAMTGNFYRLPTEAEWEYACRAGSQDAYAFGNSTSNLDDYAWFKENSNGKTHQVGQKKPNAWGLYDMHGNVAEWTLDKYDAETYSKRRKKTNVNPFVKPDKTYPRTLKGGSWADAADRLRSASRKVSQKKWKIRDPQIPKSKWWHTDAPFIGFRIVRPYKTPSAEEQKVYWKEKHTN